eukprot:TRINITY_DN5514_c0_g1_i5.p1 TRINITY_DN5514_c0_g1~~TRINITY_DN5514_c0_g1_i5.p1  ORF type:complete len:308 (+),score=48.30 TRINITY_DN5514_c0_g1_i5:388-1311(+)
MFHGCCPLYMDEILPEVPIDDLKLEKTFPLLSRDTFEETAPKKAAIFSQQHKRSSLWHKKKSEILTGTVTLLLEWQDTRVIVSGNNNRGGGKHLGLPLKTSLLESKKTRQEHIIFKACQYLGKHGTHQQGIFRINPNGKTLAEMKDILDKGQIVELERYKPIDIAGFLKAYIRQLPDRILPSNMYEEIKEIETIKELQDEEDVRKARNILQKMPVENRIVFRHIIQLLSSIAYWQDINKMTSDNLATIWAPPLLIPDSVQEDPFTFLQQSKVATAVLVFIIDRAYEIFDFASDEKIWENDSSDEDDN